MIPVEFHEPSSIAEAAALGGRLGADARFLAGGTDLIIQMQRGRAAPRHLISLRRVAGLTGITVGGHITLGALTTHRQVECTTAFRGPLEGLIEGAEVIGGHQIRNVGTVGGNIVNASPAADLVPVLLALDAMVGLTGAGGEREVALGEFLVGPGQTRRRPDEVLTRVRCSALPARSATAFLKAGRRKAMEISVVCVAARLTLEVALERCVEARIALGAVAPTAIRARAAEARLIGQTLTAEVLAAAGGAAGEECAPLSDVRASAEYRRRLVRALVPRVLERCVARIRQGGSR